MFTVQTSARSHAHSEAAREASGSEEAAMPDANAALQPLSLRTAITALNASNVQRGSDAWGRYSTKAALAAPWAVVATLPPGVGAGLLQNPRVQAALLPLPDKQAGLTPGAQALLRRFRSEFRELDQPSWFALPGGGALASPVEGRAAGGEDQEPEKRCATQPRSPTSTSLAASQQHVKQPPSAPSRMSAASPPSASPGVPSQARQPVDFRWLARWGKPVADAAEDAAGALEKAQREGKRTTRFAARGAGLKAPREIMLAGPALRRGAGFRAPVPRCVAECGKGTEMTWFMMDAPHWESPCSVSIPADLQQTMRALEAKRQPARDRKRARAPDQPTSSAAYFAWTQANLAQARQQVANMSKKLQSRNGSDWWSRSLVCEQTLPQIQASRAAQLEESQRAWELALQSPSIASIIGSQERLVQARELLLSPPDTGPGLSRLASRREAALACMPGAKKGVPTAAVKERSGSCENAGADDDAALRGAAALEHLLESLEPTKAQIPDTTPSPKVPAEGSDKVHSRASPAWSDMEDAELVAALDNLDAADVEDLLAVLQPSARPARTSKTSLQQLMAQVLRSIAFQDGEADRRHSVREHSCALPSHLTHAHNTRRRRSSVARLGMQCWLQQLVKTQSISVPCFCRKQGTAPVALLQPYLQ